MGEVAKGLAITVVASVLSVGAWILAFAALAVVPDGTAYPDDWLSLTSGEQVKWLRTHAVELKSLDAGVYMLTHLPTYGFQLFSMLFIAWVAAALAIGGWWYLAREDHESNAGDDDTVPTRFQRKLPEEEQ